jgi:hypothetical protein
MLTLVTALAFFISVTHAKADDSKFMVCATDVMRFCGEDIPDRIKITACLYRQRGSLNAACRQVFDEASREYKSHHKPHRIIRHYSENK